MKRRTLIIGGASIAAGAAVGVLGLKGRREASDPAQEPSDGVPPESEKRAPTGPRIDEPGPRVARRPSSRQNVLMIAIDDMKPWIGPHGYAAAHTPTFDALSERGVIFRRAYCAAPACSPSRAAVLTGVPPHESGCYFNRHNWQDTRPNAITLPRAMRDAGYYSVGYGKIFHGKRHDDKKAWDERVFHTHLPTPKQAPFNELHGYWREAGKLDWGPVDVPVEAMDDHKQVDRAIATMKRVRDRPWFVTCGIFRPHLPWYVPRQFFDLHPIESVPLPDVIENDLADVPKRGRWLANRREHELIVRNGLWRSAVQAYNASISYADYELGRLLAGTPDDTLIVLWSDHGWHLGPKNHWQKYTLWEESAQTVFAMAGPGVAEGEICDRTVSLLDVYPTICKACDIEPPPGLAGRDVMPLARNPGARWDRPALTTYGMSNHSVRSERYRYIRYHDGGEELYDHQSDPNEWTNLIDTPEATAIVAELARWLPRKNAPSLGSRKDRNKKDGKESQRKRKGKRRRKRKREKTSWIERPDGRRMLVPVS